ncbi:MAG: efflux RND transporter periplasmic adaptor subunit [Candidatus Zixiibacteriota bacterium]
MSQSTQQNTNSPRFLRGRGAFIIGAIVLGLAAFSLGFFLSPDSTPDTTMAEHQHGATGQSEPTVWTCSMHPQIKLPKPGKCPICFMELIPVETGGNQGDAPILTLSDAAKQIARIQTAPVRRAFQSAEINLTGKLTVDETRLTKVTARFPGRIDRLYADYTGMRINNGESLADIYSPELISAEQELIQAVKFKKQLPGDASPVLRKTADATIKASREKLRQWGLTDVQISVIEDSDEYYEYMTISSPSSGTVLEKNVVEGAYVSTGQALYTIADLNMLWINLQAYESDVVWLTEGQSVSFTVNAIPDRRFEGTIDFIDPIVDPGSRTVRVRAVVDNAKDILKPDMFVRAMIASRINKNGTVISGNQSSASLSDAPLLIPASAPLITGKRAIVYVATDGDNGTSYEGKEIILGPKAGDFYVVAEGLSEGEQVVVNGAFKIDSELQIQAKSSMMSPDRDMTIPAIATQVIQTSKPSQMKMAESEETIRALTPMYDAYFDLQMALANDNLDEAKAAYNKLTQKIESVDMGLFSMDGHMKWMEIYNAMLKETRRGSKADNIESARDAFFYLSNTMIDVHDTFGHAPEEKYFLAFCPMARNNTGAHWLQKANIIWNSFWGDKMLRCGEIQDSTESILREGK